VGYRYCQREEQQFFIPAENMPSIEEACAAYVAEHPRDFDPHHAKTALDLMEYECDWYLGYDETGNVVRISKYNESKDYHDEFLSLLAPYVKPDSFIEMEGEDDDDIFRLIFHPKFDGGFERIKAVLRFEY
jgi:hypothetical protein